MATDLTSAIVLFGIMAAVSLLEAVAVLSVFAAGALFLHRLMQVIRRIEERRVTPAVNRLNAILRSRAPTRLRWSTEPVRPATPTFPDLTTSNAISAVWIKFRNSCAKNPIRSFSRTASPSIVD